MILGSRLKKARESRGMTLTDLGVAVGRGYSLIGHVEAGRKQLSSESWVLAAKELNVSLDYLAGLSNNPLSGRDRDERDKRGDSRAGTE